VVVPWARAAAGAVATQSYANTAYGPMALELMEQGKSALETLELLINDDPEKEMRQVGLIDANGNAATFTGKECYDWAGGVTGSYFTAQGNILVDEKTVESMARAFVETDGSLAERLLAALDAGQEAGGDRRGKQSAALLVVKDKGGYGGFNDRFVDLRVDEHPDPIKELIRIYQLQQLYFAPSKPEQVVAIEGKIKSEVTNQLKRLVYFDGDLLKSLTAYIHTENFEMREQKQGFIDLEVLEFMEKQVL
jgi:uncharacterized Ntn-hydrolase superfamily protein